jgi:hypothetical protein
LGGLAFPALAPHWPQKKIRKIRIVHKYFYRIKINQNNLDGLPKGRMSQEQWQCFFFILPAQ